MDPLTLLIAAAVGYGVAKRTSSDSAPAQAAAPPQPQSPPGPLPNQLGKPMMLSPEQQQMIVHAPEGVIKFRDNARAVILRMLETSSLQHLESPDGSAIFRLVPLGAVAAKETVQQAQDAGAIVYASLSCILPQAERAIVFCRPEAAMLFARSPYFARLELPAPAMPPEASAPVPSPAPTVSAPAPAPAAKANGTVAKPIPSPIAATATEVERS